MPHPARLVTTLAAPWAFSGADTAPYLESWPTSRLLVQRGDTELIVQELTPPTPVSPVRFPRALAVPVRLMRGVTCR